VPSQTAATDAGVPSTRPASPVSRLLAFLGAGETHQLGKHRETVKSGLRYLRDVQDSEGSFGSRATAALPLQRRVRRAPR